MATVQVDLAELRQMANKFKEAANGDFQKDMEVYLDALGNEFLAEVQDQILAREVVDTRLLLNSFTKGGPENIFEQDGLTLEVGTNVYYAPYVEFGHRQEPGRFIPGVWHNGSFEYMPGAKTGMVLKASYVPGRFYFAGAFSVFKKIYMASWEKKFDEWMEKYFE